jgi:hypothetical protein
MKAFVTALALFVPTIFSTSVFSQEACQTLDAPVAAAEQHSFEVVHLEGEDMQNFVTAYNNIEPRSEHKPDQVVVFKHPTNKDAVLVMMVANTCVIVTEVIPMGMFEKMLGTGA